MKSGLVTIVIPIYNVEKYLDRSINSAVNQTYQNLEIILVDDESPDRCPEICEKWAKIDSRIKVIHKKNEGLGYARNTGIDNANGEFICFLDSDDYIALDTIEKTYKAAIENQADIVSYGFNRVNQSGEIINTNIPKPSKDIFEGSEVQGDFLPNMIAPDTESGKISDFWMSMCGALFSMSLIKNNDWRLVSERDIISEDVYSLLDLYNYVNKVVVIPKSFYFYCENSTSLTHTYRVDRFEKIKYFYLECQTLCIKHKYSDIVLKRLSYTYLSYIIAAMKMIIKSDYSHSEKKCMLRGIIDDNLTQQILRQVVLKKEKKSRCILLQTMKRKKYNLSYILLLLKTKGD